MTWLCVSAAEVESEAGVVDDSRTRVYVLHGWQAEVIHLIQRYIDVLPKVGKDSIVGEAICKELEKLAGRHGISS